MKTLLRSDQKGESSFPRRRAHGIVLCSVIMCIPSACYLPPCSILRFRSRRHGRLQRLQVLPGTLFNSTHLPIPHVCSIWRYGAAINSGTFFLCSEKAFHPPVSLPLLLWGTTAFSRGSVAMAACWRIDAHDIAVNPSEVQEMFQQNILSGDRKKSTLCRTLGLGLGGPKKRR